MKSVMDTYARSRYFQLKEVAEGIYAAISIPGTGSLGNATIIDTGDSTLVVDTFLTVKAAEDLREAAEYLIGRPVTYVFNTHWHGDHVYGNQVFVQTAQIISTTQTRQIMATMVIERITNQKADPEAVYRELEEWEAGMNKVQDEKLKQDMKWEIANDREYMKMLQELNLTLPTLTFDQQMTIYGSKRSLQLITYGGGHTQSDAFLYIPEERIAVMGDLVLANHHPVMSFANPQEWLEILDRVEELNVETIIPGHGDICSMDALHQVRNYITYMIGVASDLIQNNGNIDDKSVPEVYKEWYFSFDFKSNLNMLVEWLKNKK